MIVQLNCSNYVLFLTMLAMQSVLNLVKPVSRHALDVVNNSMITQKANARNIELIIWVVVLSKVDGYVANSKQKIHLAARFVIIRVNHASSSWILAMAHG